MFKKWLLLVAALVMLLGGEAIGDIDLTLVKNNGNNTTNSGSLIFAVNGLILDKSFVSDRQGTTLSVQIRDELTYNVLNIHIIDKQDQDNVLKNASEKHTKALIYYIESNNSYVSRYIKLKHFRSSSEFDIDFYRKDFSDAFSSAELLKFINNYRNNDPDKLSPKANSMLDLAYAREKIFDQKLLSRQLYHDFFSNINTDSDRTNFIKIYRNNDPDGLVAQAESRLSEPQKREAAATKARELQQYREAFKNAHSSSELSTFISTYSSDDPDKLVPLANKKLVTAQKREAAEARSRELREAAEAKARELHQYREAFKNARSSSDFDTFIQTYQGKDPDRLIAKAKKMKAAAEKREAAERAEAERRKAAEREESNRRWKADEPRRHHNAMCESNNSVCVSNCEAAASRQDVRYWQCKNDCDRALSRCTQ